MLPIDSDTLTRLLRNNSKWSSNRYETYIDNMHYPFILLPENYILPEVSIYGIDETSAQSYILAIQKFLPAEFREFTVLSPSHKKGERSKLTLIKIFNIYRYHYLVKCNFEMLYLGGAESKEVVVKGTQQYSASIMTNRIYFQFKIFALNSLKTLDERILELNLKNYSPSVHSRETDVRGKGFYSELFDEVDYTEILQPVYEILSLSKYWKLGRIYHPLLIENHSLGIGFLDFAPQKIINDFISFHALLKDLNEEKLPDSSTIGNFHTWLKKYTFERKISRGGNMVWKIQIEPSL